MDLISFKPEHLSEFQTIKINLDASSFAAPFEVKSIKDDGYAKGDPIEDVVDANGYISEAYTNASVITFSKIAIYAR